MKIFAIGRNYAEHVRELGNEIPEAPVVFMKPDTALLGAGEAFVYPSFSSDVHFEAELVLRVCRVGKDVSVEDAGGYFDAITVGIDFTARDLQGVCKAKGLPWEIAKSFDGSAAVGEWQPLAESGEYGFSLSINGVARQEGHSREMLNGFGRLVHHVSRYFTMAPGDLIFTGTPSGVGPVVVGDVLEGYLETRKVLTCAIR